MDKPLNFKQVAIPMRQWAKHTLSYWDRPVRILRAFRRDDLGPDLLAGLTVAVVLVPQAIAYALIAELPPQTGLYAAIVAAIVGALWGSSIHLHTGPTNAASLLVLSTLLPIAIPGTPEYLAAAGLMALMVGLVRLLMGLARLGVLVNFVSDSVIIGFTAGAGILISINQIRHLLGISVASSPSLITTTTETIDRLPEANLPSLILGLFTILVMVLIRRFRPKWPNALIAMIAASALVAIFGLDQQGVAVLGKLPRSLPPLAKLPLLDLNLMRQLFTGVLAVAALGLIEAISIARSISAQSGQHLDSNQEFVGQGLANIATGLFSGYAVSGSFTRSAVNYEAGARSPLSSVFSGLWVLIAMLVLAPLAVYIPRTALAGVLMVTAYYMIDQGEMKRIWHTSLGDSAIMIATLLATLLLPLEFAVLAGIAVSFARYLIKTSMPAVYPVVPDDNFRHLKQKDNKDVCPQLSIVTIGGSLYFGAAHHVEEVIRAELEEHPEQRFLMLRMFLVDMLDISGIHALETIVRLYRNRRGDVYLSGVREEVMEWVQLYGFDEFLGDDHFLVGEKAIGHLFHKVIDPSVCIYECKARVFAECQELPKFDYSALLPEDALQQDLSLNQWSPDELKSHLDREKDMFQLVLVDVREPGEYRTGHIPQAQLIPLRQLRKNGGSLPTDRRLVLVCRSGQRSRLAAYVLQDMGYTDLYNLRGGMISWDLAGYPLSKE